MSVPRAGAARARRALRRRSAYGRRRHRASARRRGSPGERRWPYLRVMRSVTWQQVTARRLRASRLDRPAPIGELSAVASRVLGLHAQLTTGAELALSARVDGVDRGLVHELLWERRELAKSNTLRGTLHLHPA